MTGPRAHPDGGGLAALLCEDDPGDAELVEVCLKPAPCEPEAQRRTRADAGERPVVVLADSGGEAMARAGPPVGTEDFPARPTSDGDTQRRLLRDAREREQHMRRLDATLVESATAARRWHLLADVGKVMAAGRDPEGALRAVARLLVPGAADGVALYLAGDDDLPTVVEVQHVERDLADEMERRMRRVLAGAGDAAGPLLEALDGIAAPRADAVGHGERALLEALGVTSGVAVPLRVGERAQGLLVLASPTQTPSAASDAVFARSVGDCVGVALQQVRLLRQTERAVAARDWAVGIVSHDIGNALSTIQICAAALLDSQLPSVEGMREMAQIIQRSAAWMQQIASDLVDRSSIESGRLTLDRQPVRVCDVMAAARTLFAVDAQERALEFVVESDAELPRVEADARRLLQVLSNLLGNAMKFTPTGGRIALSARATDAEGAPQRAADGPGAAVRFAVSDTGPGIPAEDVAHVFDWFWHSRRQRRSGAGLGLAIADGLVRAHHGRLRLESRPGRGCTFWFTLPSADGRDAGAPAVRPASGPDAAAEAAAFTPARPLALVQ